MDDIKISPKNKVDKVVDAEIVEDGDNAISTDIKTDSSGTALSPLEELQNIQNLINSNITKIDKLQEDIKPVKTSGRY
jgi:hypothetical protein